ncbi:VWA domain-containing protein [Chloroflexota bacterium]
MPVSITEWMTLMEAMSDGLISNLDEFYYLARAILVKSEAYFDEYDIAFQEYFKGIEAPADIHDQLMEWLSDGKKLEEIIRHGGGDFDMWELEELMREFEKRLAEQTEQHDGGGYWIGRGGTSPFGHSGTHPAGVRIGGESKGRGAVQIASERRFRNYRHDLILDVRQIKMALRPLRRLNRIGPEDELDLEQTIDATAKNAGDIEMRWRRSRRNAVKVVLLMDSGGSMEPFIDVCSRLFSAAHSSSHFKDMKYYYFHNCIYENVYLDMEGQKEISTEYLLHTMEPDYKVILVGDARMAMSELTAKYGAIYYYHRNESPGIFWLKRIADHFTHCIWMNPEEPRYWNHPTVQTIGKLFPMYELTLDGIGEAVKKLIRKR